MDRLAAYDIAKTRQVRVATRATRQPGTPKVRPPGGADGRGTMRAAFAILPVRPVRPSCCAA